MTLQLSCSDRVGRCRRDTGRHFHAADSTYYQKIIVALSETIRLMKEIDAVIALHGGWPLK
jgi:hypothetical protein